MKKFFSKPYYKDWTKKASSEIKYWFRKENEFLIKNVKKNSVVLDVGCGFGRHIKILSRFCKKVIGIDNNETMIKDAKKYLSKTNNTELYVEDAQNLHFKNNSFNYIICMTNTFGTFLNKKSKILKEMKRILKKDGEIIISVYSEKTIKVRIKNYKKVGLHIKKITNGKIIFKEGHTTEQFSKKQLNRIFNAADLNYKITELTPISYICLLTKP